ncbi:MAG: phosphatase PAP2 family protein [bacterium]
MLETLQTIDTRLLLWINGSHTPLWDEIMWFASGKWSWVPFYLMLIAVLSWKFKKNAVPMILLIALLILMSDQLASGIFKPLVQRLRPSHEPGLGETLHIVNGYRGGLYGFMSSHAANSFALAFYLTLVAASQLKWLPFVLIPWALFVSISRVYLGVHYPSDVLAPVVFSLLIAWCVSYLYHQIIKYVRRSHPLPDDRDSRQPGCME